MKPNLTVSEILDKLVVDAWFGGKRAKGGATKLKEEAERQLNELILGVIGEDEKHLSFDDDAISRNYLRAEQRKTLKETEVKDE